MMITIKSKDYTGYSHVSIDEAMVDSIKKAGKPQQIAVIETRSSQNTDKQNQYQVTVTTQEE